ncbi:hypothetical protein D6783_06080 [Candidatus Woesearchaeota archaeon]|nr:MAG: hypothetical protein D6783_06080 [Candidatus Woesearchaeota archaeon]
MGFGFLKGLAKKKSPPGQDQPEGVGEKQEVSSEEGEKKKLEAPKPTSASSPPARDSSESNEEPAKTGTGGENERPEADDAGRGATQGDDDALLAIIESQLKDLQDAVNQRLLQLEKKVEHIAKERDDDIDWEELKKKFASVDRLERNMEKFLHLYEVLTNKFNPFVSPRDAELPPDVSQSALVSEQQRGDGGESGFQEAALPTQPRVQGESRIQGGGVQGVPHENIGVHDLVAQRVEEIPIKAQTHEEKERFLQKAEALAQSLAKQEEKEGEQGRAGEERHGTQEQASAGREQDAVVEVANGDVAGKEGREKDGAGEGGGPAGREDVCERVRVRESLSLPKRKGIAARSLSEEIALEVRGPSSEVREVVREKLPKMEAQALAKLVQKRMVEYHDEIVRNIERVVRDVPPEDELMLPTGRCVRSLQELVHVLEEMPAEEWYALQSSSDLQDHLSRWVHRVFRLERVARNIAGNVSKDEVVALLRAVLEKVFEKAQRGSRGSQEKKEGAREREAFVSSQTKSKEHSAEGLKENAGGESGDKTLSVQEARERLFAAMQRLRSSLATLDDASFALFRQERLKNFLAICYKVAGNKEACSALENATSKEAFASALDVLLRELSLERTVL